MPIERSASGVVTITGENSIQYARLVTLKAALRMETHGLGRKGMSAYSMIKKEFGLTGSKGVVLAKFEKLINEKYPTPESAQ
jgi:hypothetical protein